MLSQDERTAKAPPPRLLVDAMLGRLAHWLRLMGYDAAYWRDGSDEALIAADELEKAGVQARVINMHTLKPLDENAIISAARECGGIVTAEEHQIYGGLGSACAQVVARECPVPMDYVAVMDRFGESGQPEELLRAFGLTSSVIIQKAQKVLQRKNK